MPLIKLGKNASKARKLRVASQNIAKEISAGKPRKQAIAIGLSSAKIKKKKAVKRHKPKWK